MCLFSLGEIKLTCLLFFTLVADHDSKKKQQFNTLISKALWSTIIFFKQQTSSNHQLSPDHELLLRQYIQQILFLSHSVSACLSGNRSLSWPRLRSISLIFSPALLLNKSAVAVQNSNSFPHQYTRSRAFASSRVHSFCNKLAPRHSIFAHPNSTPTGPNLISTFRWRAPVHAVLSLASFLDHANRLFWCQCRRSWFFRNHFRPVGITLKPVSSFHDRLCPLVRSLLMKKE